MTELKALAELLKKRKQIDDEISKLIRRPAIPQHIGEFIGSKILQIQLSDSATTKGIDGIFIAGPLKGKTVNIKLYGKQQGNLDIETENMANYYLVLTGPRSQASSSKGETRSIEISNVYLFDMQNLVPKLMARNLKIGTATSVAKSYWEEAKIYPEQKNKTLELTRDQIQLLEMFNFNEKPTFR